MNDVQRVLPDMIAFQTALLTDTLSIYRDGVLIASNIPCRAHPNRLFAEPGDPSDANMRSMGEWGITMPISADVRVSDRLVVTTPGGTLDLNVGEVEKAGTWQIMQRAWGNRPKTATPHIWITLRRGDTILPPQYVQVVYDRNRPEERPERYTPAARTSYKGGWLIGDTSFDVQVEDIFTLDGLAGVIVQVLPLQPQRKEAKFMLDVGGA